MPTRPALLRLFLDLGLGHFAFAVRAARGVDSRPARHVAAGAVEAKLGLQASLPDVVAAR
eukprot:COSAG01_NODE_49188_length_374_cov_1.080000_1_plen_59_part_10